MLKINETTISKIHKLIELMVWEEKLAEDWNVLLTGPI